METIMAKATLTLQEKYAIQGMLHDECDTKEIAKELGRQKRTIQTYIDEELGCIHETIVKIKMEKAQELEPETTEPEMTEAEEIEVKTEEALRQERVDKAVKQALEQTPKTKKVGNIRKRKPAANQGIIGRKKGGIAVMTEAGSEISDAIQQQQKSSKTISRSARGNMYMINEEEIV